MSDRCSPRFRLHVICAWYRFVSIYGVLFVHHDDTYPNEGGVVWLRSFPSLAGRLHVRWILFAPVETNLNLVWENVAMNFSLSIPKTSVKNLYYWFHEKISQTNYILLYCNIVFSSSSPIFHIFFFFKLHLLHMPLYYFRLLLSISPLSYSFPDFLLLLIYPYTFDYLVIIYSLKIRPYHVNLFSIFLGYVHKSSSYIFIPNCIQFSPL